MKEQQVCNILITLELLDFLLDNPNLRFVQTLWALGIADDNDLFYEPSRKTLDKVRAKKRLAETERRFNVKVRENFKKIKEAT